jgi:hypothetical protein
MKSARRVVASHPAEWLSLAATPSFALMAALTGILNGGAHQMSCASPTHMSPLGGMVPMYALMSVFHFVPWLKLVFRLKLSTAPKRLIGQASRDNAVMDYGTARMP